MKVERMVMKVEGELLGAEDTEKMTMEVKEEVSLEAGEEAIFSLLQTGKRHLVRT